MKIKEICQELRGIRLRSNDELRNDFKKTESLRKESDKLGEDV